MSIIIMHYSHIVFVESCRNTFALFALHDLVRCCVVVVASVACFLFELCQFSSLFMRESV